MGGGGGGGNSLINQLLSEWRRTQDEAKKANEDRYNDIINYGNQRLTRNLGRSEGLGTIDRQQIGKDYDRLSANADQDLISRGFRNSSVRQNVQRSVEDDRQFANARLGEMLRREQIGIDMDASGDVIGAMERRTDSYPEQLTSLFMQLGLAGQLGGSYGAGGGGGGQVPAWITLPGGGVVRNPAYGSPVT
jgi:hypothetical protein